VTRRPHICALLLSASASLTTSCGTDGLSSTTNVKSTESVIIGSTSKPISTKTRGQAGTGRKKKRTNVGSPSHQAAAASSPPMAEQLREMRNNMKISM
jgi:hypothetical protein